MITGTTFSNDPFSLFTNHLTQSTNVMNPEKWDTLLSITMYLTEI